MTKVLVYKILFFAAVVVAMNLASAQSISYNPVFDLSLGATFTDNQSVATEETTPLDLTFSNDGMKVFIIGGEADEINQYALSSAFDISGGLTHEGTLSVTTEETQPYALTFNDDGSKLYVLGFSVDRIFQYSLSANFDITSTVTLDGFTSTRFGNPNSLAFSNDGLRVYIGSTSTGHVIQQLDLTTPFDVTGTMTSAGTSEVLSNSVYDFEFTEDGSRIFVLGTNDAVKAFELETAFDVSSTLTQIGAEVSVASQELNTYGLAFSPFGDRFFIIGIIGDDINQYDLSESLEYKESILNNGSLVGEFTTFGLKGETFSNGGGTLTYNTDYTISNLPPGLTPVLEVGSSATYATFSFTGEATDHQNSDDVGDLIFTFNNSAFTGGDASSVTNAVGANSGIALNFRNNGSPIVTYGSLPNVSGAAFNENVLDISVDVFNAGGMTFNNDGTKLFIIDTQYDYVYDYSLTTAYDITSGASYSGDSYFIGGDETSPTGVAFSTDGLTMFIVGQTGDDVTQYSLSAAYDLTSTIENQGTFSVIGEAIAVHDISFSPDGKTMLLAGPDLYQYGLTTPFDITSGVSHESTFDQTSTILSAVFGPDGSQILYTNSNRAMGIYDLVNPYDLSGGVSGGAGINVLSQENFPTGVAFSPDRKKIFMCGAGSDNVNQYAISPNRFEESFNDDGTIIGTLNLRVINDQFNNATATLTQGIHYNVTGLPSGLSSSLAIASNGLTAEMTINGTALSNDIIDNIDNITFTFNNSAFKNSDAADVLNAVSGDSYFSVNFKELSGQIFGSEAYQLTGMTFDDNPVSVVNETGSPYQMTFSNDGSTMFMISSDGNVYQYALTTPYDVSSGITLEGNPLNVSANESIPVGMTFNDDGSKMYIIGSGNDKVHQYSLGTSFDINGTVTHEGEFSFTNGIGITFSPDGSRMFLTSSALVYQYTLNTPFDITAGASQVGSAQTGSANSYSPTFSPNGMEFFVMGGSHRNIYRYPLSSAFDITEGLTSDQSLSVSGQDTSPSSMIFSGDGKTVFVTGLVGDDINIYELPSISFSEVVVNSGALDGEYTFTLIGDSFVNAGGTLSPSTHFSLSGLPVGLSGSMAVSGDGSTATFSFTGNASDHQDADDVAANIEIEFLDAAFSGASASSVYNSSVTLAADIDFTDNGSLTYTPDVFNETYINTGEVEGSMLVTIVNETFSKTGLLIEDVDYSITGIPAGLTPALNVAGNRLSATLTISGTATNHQDSDDISGIAITFENSSFTTSDAQYVFDAIGYNTGSSIDFDDNNPRVTYGNRFDLSDYPSYIPSVTYDFSAMEDSPGSFAFSNDGLKMFLVGYTNDEVFEYHLTSAFDISNVTYSGNSYALTEVPSPSDLTFNDDGTIMFVMDGSGDEIEQYSLSSAFDLSSSITHQGTFELNGQDIQPSAMSFSPNGKKMYMVGSFNDKVFQYSLDNPFDLTSGASYDEVEVAISGLNYTDIEITEDGKTLFISNSAFPGASYIRQYSLTTPFDISDGISVTGGFNFHDIDYGPSGYALSPDNKRLIVLGGNKDLIYQFDLPIDGFEEVTLNNGEVSGSLYIEIDDDSFANAGSTMTYGSDFSIGNLPSGLSASMSVAADGYSATVSLSGSATNHQDADDTELAFTFNNSAFVNSNAADVQNATNANSSRSIDYRNNNPALSFGNTLDMDYASLAGTLDVSNWGDYTSGIVFSNDGLKMFLSVYGTSSVHQYSLTEAYDITTGVNYIGAYNYSAEDGYAEDLAFSTDGTKFYILGNDTYTVYQYNMSTPFDITSGVSYSGNSFNHEDFDTSVYGFTISVDGTKMYIAGTNDYEIFQFSLFTAFDISSASFDGDPLLVEDVSVTGIKFSSDGRYILMTEDNDYSTARYKLFVPWDVTQGGIFQESFDLDAINVWPSGLGISPDGSNVYIVDGDNYAIQQYNINLGDFTETVANDGTVEGSTNIYLIDDEFSNAGGTLVHGADYTINNLPSGLTPTLTVDTEGYFASLSLSGSVASHGDADDLPSLQFTFNNSAFSNYDAVDVGNSSNYNAGFGIDYSPYTDNDIVSFSFGVIDGTATIDDGAHSVVAEAIAGTDISALSPTIGVSTNASINPGSGSEEDFTSTVVYEVTAEDGTPQDWDITITEALADPTNITLSSLDIDENLSTNSLVGILSTEDASFSDTHTYTFASGGGDDDNGSFTITGDQLTLNISADFETKDSYNVRIQTDDGKSGLFDKSFTITINDVNEAPTDIFLSNTTIDESNPSGSVVGDLSPEDVDQTDSHTYSLKEGNTDNESFEISGDQLVTAEVLDFETKTTYNLEIIVTDQGGLTFEQEFAISVNNLPAQITSIELDNTTIDENENVGTVVGAFSTFGEDLSGNYTYTFATGMGDDDNGSFTISGDQLLTSESFNFEVKDSYSVRIMTDDGNLDDSFALTILVNDANDVPTDITLNVPDITENNSIGEAIGAFSTEDEDVGQSFTYSLVSGSGDTDNASFDIVGNELQAGEVFDFETQDSYSVRIETNDGNGGIFSKSFTISITDENESIVVVNPIADQPLDEGFRTLDIDLSSVFEDLDGDALTYNISSSDTDIVTVSNSESILTITEVGGFGSSTITVAADDGSGITTSDEFVITVSNVNDAPIVVNPLDDQTAIVEGFGAAQFNYSDVFEDADGDELSITVTSSDEDVVTAEVIANNQIQVNEVGIGTSTITLTADDGNGGTVSDEFIFTVNETPNNAPVVVNPLGDQTAVEEGFGAAQFNYADVFEDADGDALTITVTSSDETVVTAGVIANNQIQVNEVGIGTSTITLTADDGNGGTVSDEFIFTVNEAPLGVTGLEVKIYPNPSSDFIYVKSNETVSVRLTDLNGREIQSKSGSQLELNIQSLSPGLYILQVNDGDRSSSHRIIKAN